MLDLKAKLAAAGFVTEEQVKKFDENQAKEKQAKAQKHHSGKKPPTGTYKGKSQNTSKHNKSGQKHPGQKPPGHKQSGQRTFQKKPHRKPQHNSRSGINVEALKNAKRNDAYTQMRKIVEHSRLDDREQTIPGADDQTFSFVTALGRIGRLYLTDKTVATLTNGTSAVVAFMSHHGLSHCVLPKDVALDFAEVFPLWLRHLRDHPEAGKIAEPEEPKRKPAAAQSPATDASAEDATAATTTDSSTVPAANASAATDTIA